VIWSACRQWNIDPPEFPKIKGRLRWDDLTEPLQAYIIGFEQTREYEDSEREAQLAKAMVPRMATGKGKK
jgi:hypothetical protein